MSSSDTFVIVGAGMAGGKAAETLREEGFDGRVVLLGAEPHRPYERPPLSKDYLRGEAEQPAWLQEDEGWYAANNVELRTSSVVQSIDAGDKAVVLGGGERIGYDRLLLATGGEPRALPVPGGDLEGVHLLRTIEDSNGIRALFDGGGRLVVIGGGWIGCEVAASARQKGMDVTLIESLELPLLRVLGPELGGFYRGVHEDQGVEMLLGAGVDAIEGSGRAERVRLSDGKTIDCAAVVVGIGVAPRTELVDGIARVDNGVVVDERLQSSRTASSPAATSPTPRTRCSPSTSAWSTGPTRSSRGRPRRARCSARPSATTRCRTSSPTSTTSGWSTPACTTRTRTSSSCAAT